MHVKSELKINTSRVLKPGDLNDSTKQDNKSNEELSKKATQMTDNNDITQKISSKDKSLDSLKSHEILKNTTLYSYFKFTIWILN